MLRMLLPLRRIVDACAEVLADAGLYVAIVLAGIVLRGWTAGLWPREHEATSDRFTRGPGAR